MFSLFLCYDIGAQPINSNFKGKKSQIRIRSDIIDIKQKSQKIDFIENVVVEKDGVSLLSKQMSVYYLEKQSKLTSKNNSNIKEILANGNVKMFSNNFVASSNKAKYDPVLNVITLEEDVVVNNGSSVASGDKFIYNMTTKIGDFVGKANNSHLNNNIINGDDRVTVIIGNDIKEQKDNFKKIQEDFK